MAAYPLRLLSYACQSLHVTNILSLQYTMIFSSVTPLRLSLLVYNLKAPQFPVSTGYAPPFPVSTGHALTFPVSTGYAPPFPVSTGHAPPFPVSTGYAPPFTISTGHAPPFQVSTGYVPTYTVSAGHATSFPVSTGYVYEFKPIHPTYLFPACTGHVPEFPVYIFHVPAFAALVWNVLAAADSSTAPPPSCRPWFNTCTPTLHPTTTHPQPPSG
jgi:hypothetical protein